MKQALAFLRTILIVGLLMLLGGVVEYRYGIVDRLPVNLMGQSATSHDINPETLSNLMNTQKPESYSKVDFNVFWEAWSMLEKYYVQPEKLEAQKMVDGAIGGMIASVGDPYTMYLPKEDKIRTGQDLAGAFYGVGIELGYVEGNLAVVAPLDGSPAAQAGVQAGDLILRVKDEQKEVDEDSHNWSLTHAVDVIRGPRNTPVTLTLYRRNNGNEPFDVTINRDEIIVKSVEVEFIENNGKKVAHIKLSRFGERTIDEWNGVVQQILAQKSDVSGVLLDMRNNPGGFFDDAIAIASDFIPNGVVVSQKGRTMDQDFKATGNPRLKNVPVIVVVNGGSASASEIVAGALRDQVNSKLVGQKTFGKGTVQDRRDLSNGGALHVTIARWMMPKGEWIHEEGIPVDIEVTDDPETPEDEVLLKAMEQL